MFKELKNVRQNEGEPRRRIFTCDNLSLTVWQQNDSLKSFQICYEDNGEAMLFSWDADKGFSNRIIDQGESRLFKHKMAAVPLANKSFNKEPMLSRLKSNKNAQIPSFEFILNKISSY